MVRLTYLSAKTTNAHSKTKSTDDKLSLKGAWLHHVIHFKFLVPSKISMELLKLKTSNFVHWLAKWSISLQIDKQSLKWASLWSQDLFKFWQIIDRQLLHLRRDVTTRRWLYLRWWLQYSIHVYILKMAVNLLCIGSVFISFTKLETRLVCCA